MGLNAEYSYLVSRCEVLHLHAAVTSDCVALKLAQLAASMSQLELLCLHGNEHLQKLILGDLQVNIVTYSVRPHMH